MSTYTYTFATRALYIAEKAAPAAGETKGGDIYEIVSNISSGSAAVVSHITGTGETFIDSVNQIVDREAGQIGDILIYNATAGEFKWCKGGTYSASAYGGTTHSVAALNSAGWTCVGFCVERRRNNCWIASMNANDGSDKMCTTTNTEFSMNGVKPFTCTTVKRVGGTNKWWACLNQKKAESYFSTTGNRTYLPVTRDTWNAAGINATVNETAYQGEVSELPEPSSTYENKVYKLTTDNLYYVCTKQDDNTYKWSETTLTTVNKAKYNNDFDEYHKSVYMAKMPMYVADRTSIYEGAALSDEDGKNNTYIIENNNVSLDHAAVDLCAAYGVSGVSDFATGKWYMPALGQISRMVVHYYRLLKCGCPITTYGFWTSTQYLPTHAWRVTFINGLADGVTRTNAYCVRAFSDFQI